MSSNNLPDFDALWNFGKPGETEIELRRIFDETEEHANPAYLAELQTQIARTLSLQRKFDEAHATLDAIEQNSAIQKGRPRVRYLLERGRTYNSSGHKASAASFFIEAWEIASSIGEDGFAVDAAHMVAIAEEPDKALLWNLKALELANSSEMPTAKKWRKSLQNNLGWMFAERKEYATAIAHFKESQNLAIEADDSESERIARWCIAKMLRFQGQYAQALEMQTQQFAELEALGRTSAFVYEELAECQYALDMAEESKVNFALAYEGLAKDPSVAEDEPDRLTRLGVLAGIVQPRNE